MGEYPRRVQFLPIWITDSFRPVRARLIDGMTELLLGLDIVRGLDIAVVFGSNQFRIGQVESEIMTYNGKHRWAFPLVLTACAYNKLGDYFRGIKKEQIEVLHVQGDFEDRLEVRKVAKSESPKLQGKVEIANR